MFTDVVVAIAVLAEVGPARVATAPAKQTAKEKRRRRFIEKTKRTKQVKERDCKKNAAPPKS